MSKSDAMRAMREARYARTTTAVPTRRVVPAADGVTEGTDTPKGAAAPKKAEPRKAAKKASPATTVEPATSAGGELCGHRSMNGRSCTREAGHSEKNHRYS